MNCFDFFKKIAVFSLTITGFELMAGKGASSGGGAAAVGQALTCQIKSSEALYRLRLTGEIEGDRPFDISLIRLTGDGVITDLSQGFSDQKAYRHFFFISGNSFSVSYTNGYVKDGNNFHVQILDSDKITDGPFSRGFAVKYVRLILPNGKFENSSELETICFVDMPLTADPFKWRQE
jgi:hypothetical protein